MLFIIFSIMVCGIAYVLEVLNVSTETCFWLFGIVIAFSLGVCMGEICKEEDENSKKVVKNYNLNYVQQAYLRRVFLNEIREFLKQGIYSNHLYFQLNDYFNSELTNLEYVNESNADVEEISERDKALYKYDICKELLSFLQKINNHGYDYDIAMPIKQLKSLKEQCLMKTEYFDNINNQKVVIAD